MAKQPTKQVADSKSRPAATAQKDPRDSKFMKKLRKIGGFEKSKTLGIRKPHFQDLVREVAREKDPNAKITMPALLGLQEISEAFMTHEFRRIAATLEEHA